MLRDSTTTTVTASLNPAVAGNTITFTAQVQANGPGAGTPTGSITFKDITTILGAATLNGTGLATFTTSALVVGTHAISASYAGDTNFLSSFSPDIAEVVKASSRNTVANSAIQINLPAISGGSLSIPEPASIHAAPPTRVLLPPFVDALFASGQSQRAGSAHLRTKPALWTEDWLGGVS